jgi:hypothetical protein
MFNNEYFEPTSIEKCILLTPRAHITSKEFEISIPRLMPKLEKLPPITKNEPTNESSHVLNKTSMAKNVSTANFLKAKAMTDYRSWMFGQIYKMTHSHCITETEVVPVGGSYAKPPFKERVDEMETSEVTSPSPTIKTSPPAIRNAVVKDLPDFVFKPFEQNGVSRPINFPFSSMDLKHDHLVDSRGDGHPPQPHRKHVHPIIKPFQFFNVKYEGLNDRVIKYGHEMIGCFVSGDLNDFRIMHIPDIIPMKGD